MLLNLYITGTRPMKKLLYILPIFLILISCSDEPTKAIEEGQSRTVFGLERTFENSTIAGLIGDLSKNYCTNIDSLEFFTFPNPTASGVTIEFKSDSRRTYEIFLETAIGDENLLDSLAAISYPTPIIIAQHESYFKQSLISGSIKEGKNSIHIDLRDISTGVYYLIYNDNKGNSDCYPLVVQRYGNTN